MIWKIPWALGVVTIYVAYALSWILLPRPAHERIWSRNLCRWAMHDYESDGAPWPVPITLTCCRCGHRAVVPRAV